MIKVQLQDNTKQKKIFIKKKSRYIKTDEA